MKGLIARFNDGIVNKTNSGCMEVSPTGSGGYGKIKAFGKTMLYHRLSFELFVGSIPDGMLVCHKCDNPKCVNPEHLFLGSQQENMDDKIKKGRHVGAKKGHKHHKAKLVEWQVLEIKKKLKNGTGQHQLSKEFGVDQSTISNIATGKRWGHVNG
ncbi:HNH endonuclease signature motif containing protein [Shewanella algae]|uniref:HNH endonuclease signature motif containing protein n=1 Tax=Shewanella algae TaxID=38313 RepID=UPI0034D6B1F0